MTSARLLMLVRELSPSSFSDSMIMLWISEIEYALAADISEVDPSRLVEMTEPTQEPMLIPHPFDRVYLPYVQAMVANAQGETDLYQNYIAKYNAYRDEWAAWVLNGRTRNNAYYIDAYQLAREHGYEGTIEQWLDGLKGEKGDKGDGVLIKAHYDTLELLRQAHPVGYLGDYYEVGLSPDDAVVYYWDSAAGEWHGIDIVDGQRKAREAAEEAAVSAKNAGIEGEYAARQAASAALAAVGAESAATTAGNAAQSATEAAAAAALAAGGAENAAETAGSAAQSATAAAAEADRAAAGIQGAADEIERIGEQSDKTWEILSEMIYTSDEVDLGAYSQIKTMITSSTGKWNSVGTNRQSVFVPTGNVEYVEITANAEQNTVVAQLRDNSHEDGTTPNYSENGYRMTIEPGKTKRITIDADCKYIWVLVTYGTTIYKPDGFTKVTRKPESKTPPIGLHELPENDGVLNCIKRCRQLTDIKWVPKVDIPRICLLQADVSGDSGESSLAHFEDVFRAGVEYTGIPYSRADKLASGYGYTNFHVGFVPISSFITAARSAASALATQSEYSERNNRAPLYGTVCSGLASYALGLDRSYATSEFAKVPGMKKVGALTGFNANSLRLCDILLYSGFHIAIITDIIRDDEGNVTSIEVSEATTAGNADWDNLGGKTGGVCRRKGWSVDDLYNWFQSYSVYRYDKMGEITYAPDPFVNVGDELDMMVNADMPCLPYMGDGFVYKAGYIPNADIVVNSQRFDKLKVLKDGVPWNADGSQDPYTVSGGAVHVGFNAAGTYTAYLCNEDASGNELVRSKSCRWSVV